MNASDPFYIVISALAIVVSAIVTIVVTLLTLRSNKASLKKQLDSQAEATAAQLRSQADLMEAQLDSQADLTRTQLLADMISRGLGFFGGGSQNRTIGIAALQIVAKDESVWPKYRDAIASLLYGQLLFLFAHGENRWAAHEIANIVSMSDWLIDSQAFSELSADRKTLLLEEMEEYGKAAKRHAKTPAIIDIEAKLISWQGRLRGGTTSGGRRTPRRASREVPV